jgi:hypothetical protein
MPSGIATYLGVCLLAVLLLLNVAVSVGLIFLDTLTRPQKAAWLLLLWLMPVVGLALALHLFLEARAIKTNLREPGPDVGIGGGDIDFGSDFGGHGDGGGH